MPTLIVIALAAMANAASPVSNAPLLHLYTTGNSFMNFSELQKRRGQAGSARRAEPNQRQR
jgi:hypothetical protein